MSSACISNVLRLQLGVDRCNPQQSKTVQGQRLTTSSQHILCHKIIFERARQQTSNHLLALKAKYPPINSKMAPVSNVHGNNAPGMCQAFTIDIFN